MFNRAMPSRDQTPGRQMIKRKALSGARGILTGLGVSGSFWLATLVLFLRP